MRERLLKGILDKLQMKEDFDAWRYILRDMASKIDDTGTANDVADFVTTVTPHFLSATFPTPVRGRGAYAGYERGRGNVYPQPRKIPRGFPVAGNAGHRGGLGRVIPIPHRQQRNSVCIVGPGHRR